MKKVMLTLALVVFAGAALYAYAPAKATFSTEDGRLMRVYIDGNLINHQPRQFVSVSKIRAGKHRVVLEVFGRRGRKIKTREIIVLRPGLESRFRVRKRGRRNIALQSAGYRELGRGHYRYPVSKKQKYYPRKRVLNNSGYRCNTYKSYGY